MNPQRRRARLLLLHCLPSPSPSSPAACSFYATNVACASLLNPWSRRGSSRPILALTPRQRVQRPPSGFPPSCRPTRSSTFFSRTSSYSTSAGTTLTGNLSVGNEDPQPPPNEESEATNTTTTTAWKETQRKIQACLEERQAAREAQYDVRPVYYFDRRLNARHVEPYYFCYHTTVKASWQGLTLRQVINTFVHHNNDYFEWAVENGKITLNGERTEPDAVLRNGYIIQHQTHVHEAPVTADPIEILPDTDEEVLAVNKPPGIPVHPVARYRFNSVQHVLAFEHGLFPLYGFHRLDLPTSGILLFARTLDTAQTLANDVRERQLEKVYYARVAGNFPEGEKEVSSPLYVEPRLGASVVDETLGRTSKTIFHKEAYDPRSNTSLVRCVPVTGRPHQIRVHLQWLGHPIPNDFLYGENGSFDEAFLQRRKQVYKDMAALPKEDDDRCNQKHKTKHKYHNQHNHIKNPIFQDWLASERRRMEERKQERIRETAAHIASLRAKEEVIASEEAAKEEHAHWFDPYCPECVREKKHGMDQRLNSMLWLHAYSYQLRNKTYTAPLPPWALHI